MPESILKTPPSIKFNIKMNKDILKEYTEKKKQEEALKKQEEKRKIGF